MPSTVPEAPALVPDSTVAKAYSGNAVNAITSAIKNASIFFVLKFAVNFFIIFTNFPFYNQFCIVKEVSQLKSTSDPAILTVKLLQIQSNYILLPNVCQ